MKVKSNVNTNFKFENNVVSFTSTADDAGHKFEVLEVWPEQEPPLNFFNDVDCIPSDWRNGV